MNEDVRIRYADVNDAAVLGEIHALSWKVTYRGIVPDAVLDAITVEKMQQRFAKALGEGTEEDAIAFCTGQAAGFICLGKSRDADAAQSCGEVWGIYLRPECWRRGIGAQLMRWGLKELKRRGFEEATLWVLEENLPAHAFYEKMGFAPDNTVKDIVIGKALKECRYRITL
jgi:ribosomal protein S18 acetylase RimI-like enzyme